MEKLFFLVSFINRNMAEYQDINLLFCNKNKLNVERNQYKRYSDKQLVFYKERIFQIQKLLHRLFLLKSTDAKDTLEHTDNEIEDLEYMLPDTLQDIYESFLIETIDYLSFQDQSDELQEEIQCQIKKSRMNKLREKLNTVDVDASSDDFNEEQPLYKGTNDDLDDELDGDLDGDLDENDSRSNVTLNPITNTLIVKKKSINNKALVKKSVLHKKHTFDPYSSKLKKKKIVYGKKYK